MFSGSTNTSGERRREGHVFGHSSTRFTNICTIFILEQDSKCTVSDYDIPPLDAKSCLKEAVIGSNITSSSIGLSVTKVDAGAGASLLTSLIALPMSVVVAHELLYLSHLSIRLHISYVTFPSDLCDHATPLLSPPHTAASNSMPRADLLRQTTRSPLVDTLETKTRSSFFQA